MKKINTILFGASIWFWQLAMPTNNSEKLQTLLTSLPQVQIEQTTSPEFEKWEYLAKQFESDIYSKSQTQKIGHYLKKYSAAITISSGLFYTMLSIYIYEHYLKQQRYSATGNITTTPKEVIIDVKTRHYTYFREHEELLTYFAVAFFITDLLALTYISLKTGGGILENRNQKCYQELINFVKMWDENKPKTPVILHPLFEQLSTDLGKNENFTKINLKDAKHIVDVIIATSLYINSSLKLNQ